MDDTYQVYRGIKLCDPKSVNSGIMHYAGMVVAIAATFAMVSHANRAGSTATVVSCAVFGISMILLYGASATYHVFYISHRVHRVLKKVDHCMVFVLIAGTYTPICVAALGHPVGTALLTVVWGLSIAGIVMKALWIDAPKWLSVLCYVLIGWAAIFAIVPIHRAIGSLGVAMLLGGGVIYTVGAFIYKAERQIVNTRYWGNHEIFHVMIIVASALIYAVIYRAV